MTRWRRLLIVERRLVVIVLALGMVVGCESGSDSVLLGKPAPDFQLDRLHGGQAKLSTHRNEDVVILDFWATWCGPCGYSLPIIAKVAEKYRTRGVVFYAIDLQETPDKVEKFLADHQLNIPVVFDRDGSVASRYQVNGIPQTVLIGKDGTVQVVHVGASAGLEEQLNQELDALLAGKELAAETENHEIVAEIKP